MKGMILIISCLLLIGIVVGGKEGYLMDHEGCKLSCFIRPAGYCGSQCKMKKASSGYCAWPSCYCYGLPNSEKVWERKTNRCGKK
uniref:NaTx n=1 Tax=Tityus melici TaxID=3026321 RepID=A0AA49QCM3_9SCOR|nr:putative NaTx [Tityus melici]